MIEEIKKKLSGMEHRESSYINFKKELEAICKLGEATRKLNKYKDKEDKYKNAWEDLQKFSATEPSEGFAINYKIKMQELEKKHGIGVE